MMLIQSVIRGAPHWKAASFVVPDLSVVVPAKAGTHTPCHGDVARPACNRNVWGYGSPPARGRQSIGRSFPHTSHPEIRRRDRFAGEACGGAFECDAALLQTIDMRGGLERLHDVLLNDDERQ